MNTASAPLHNKVHNWMDMIGFQLNSSAVSPESHNTVNHYFFKTFNFLEEVKNDAPGKPRFTCFDTYGEAHTVKNLSDLQTAFYDNISQLK